MKFIDKFYLYFAFLMAFFLPLAISFSNLFLILFLVALAYVLFVKKERVSNKPALFIFSLLIIYVVYIVWLLVSENPIEGFKTLEKSLSFLLCPILLFFSSKHHLVKIKKKLFYGLVYGSTVSISILLVNNFFNYFATRPFLHFDDELFSYYHTYYYFTDYLDLHPTYLGVYVLFSMTILFFQLFNTTLKKVKWACLFMILLFSISIVFINSRIIFLLYGLALMVSLCWYTRSLFNQKKLTQVSLLIAVGLGVLVLLITSLSNTFIFTRMTKEISWDLSTQVDTKYNSKTSSDSRLARWNAALAAIKEKPILGYGTHTEKDVLESYYIKNGLDLSAKKRYDAHNMYLSIIIEYGLVGLLIFLFFLTVNFYVSISVKDMLYISFLVIVVTVSLFENYFKNNAGITFIALFSTVMFFHAMELKKTEP